MTEEEGGFPSKGRLAVEEGFLNGGFRLVETPAWCTMWWGLARGGAFNGV